MDELTLPHWPVAMVTAHRPQHLDPASIPWIQAELARVCHKLARENDTTTAISGMALGGDQWWAATAKDDAGMRLHAHIPFPQQPDPWTSMQRLAYRALLRRADRIVPYGDLAGIDDKHERLRKAIELLHARNDGMIAETVTAAGAVVAVLRSSRKDGGTRSAYDKARAMLPIVRIDPDRRTTTISRPPVPEHIQEALPI